MIKISIADDHQLFRQGISSLINTIPTFQVVYEASTGLELLDFLKTNEVDLVLMDINMPEMDGIECSKTIKAKYPTLKIIVLSMHADHETIQTAISIGVDGYLPKDTGKEELKEAIDAVFKGEKYFNKSITNTIMNGLVSTAITQPIRLTPREKDVLNLICQEFTSNEIAEKLFISFNTVETHRKSLLHKTGSKNSIGLLKFALDNNLYRKS